MAFEALLPLGNTKSLQDMPVMLRLLVSVYGLLFYLQKTLVPLDLSPLYPLSFQVTWLQFGALIGGAYLAWACRHRVPAFTAAAIVYVVTVAPVIGVFQNGPQAAADRYTYLPCLGWAALAGGAVARWWPRRGIVVPVAATWLAALAFLTWQQTSLWKDPVSLWSQAAVVTPTMRAAHFKLAQAHAEEGRIAEAIAAYREAIRLSGPSAPWGHLAIARLLERARLDDAARVEYEEALREEPAYREACDGLVQLVKRRGGRATGATVLRWARLVTRAEDELRGGSRGSATQAFLFDDPGQQDSPRTEVAGGVVLVVLHRSVTPLALAKKASDDWSVF